MPPIPHSLPVRPTREWTALPTLAIADGLMQLPVSTYVIIMTDYGGKAQLAVVVGGQSGSTGARLSRAGVIQRASISAAHVS